MSDRTYPKKKKSGQLIELTSEAENNKVLEMKATGDIM